MNAKISQSSIPTAFCRENRDHRLQHGSSATDFHSQVSVPAYLRLRQPGIGDMVTATITNRYNQQTHRTMTTSTKADIKTCSACRYWNEQSDNEGECRVRPPQAISFRVDEETHFETVFPVTKAEDWCGEFAEA